MARPYASEHISSRRRTSSSIVSKLARLGTGFPAIYNDEVAIKMMLLSGGTMEEARNYQMVGCVEPFMGGKMAKWWDAWTL